MTPPKASRRLVLLLLLLLAVVYVVQVAAHSSSVDAPIEDVPFLFLDDDNDNEEEASSLPPPPPPYEDPLQEIRTKWKLEPVIQLDSAAPGLLSRLLSAPTSPATSFAILFVSSSPASLAMAADFSHVARTHWNELERRRSVSTSPMYFLQANASKSTRLFREHGISKAPSLVYVKSGNSAWEEYDGRGGVAQWLGAHSGLPLVAATTPVATATSGGVMSAEQMEVLARVALLVQLGAFLFTKRESFRTKRGWFVLSLCVYAISVSGLIFCFLRGMPPLAYSPQHGGIVVIYPDQRNQFIFEGLLACGACVGLSVALTAAAFYADGVDVFDTVENLLNDREPALVFRRITVQVDDNDSDKNKQQHLLVLRRRQIEQYEDALKTAKILLFASSMLLVALVVMFQRKASWYQPFF